MRNREVLLRELAHRLLGLTLFGSLAPSSFALCLPVGGGLTWTLHFQLTAGSVGDFSQSSMEGMIVGAAGIIPSISVTRSSSFCALGQIYKGTNCTH